jgi:hypothetical protein
MKLSEMNVRNLPKLQQRALLRLHLLFTAETHRLYAGFGDEAAAFIQRSADRDGNVDGAALVGGLATVAEQWRKCQQQWRTLLAKAREEAAALPFGALIVAHNHYFRPFAQVVTEALSPTDAATLTRHWQALRQRVLDKAAARIYSDGFHLSGRVWRLEADGLVEIQRILSSALATQTSAAELARLLTASLGAGEDCPRWAYGRLYGMTAKERATNSAGLRNGTPCEAKGLAYNALRLARNEMQIAHHLVNDELFRVSPWITGEQVRLSATHPKPDICDDVANGGPYEPGEVTLPLHVQCLCWKEAVTMGTEEFRGRVRGWLDGNDNFLDNYRDWLSVDPVQLFDWSMHIPKTLEVWLSGLAADHSAALGV